MSTPSYGIGLLGGLALALAAGSSHGGTLLITSDELHPDTFPEAAALIRDNLAAIPPQNLSTARRNQALRVLAEMERLLADGPGRHADALRALQERVNRALAPAVAREAGGSPIVCKRVKPVGSRIVTVQCLSQEEREIAQWRAQEFLTQPNVPTNRRGPLARAGVE